MHLTGLTRRSLVDCGVAGRPLDGQSVSGDVHVVKPFGSGVLVALIDGLGHGQEATAAASIAAQLLEKNAAESVLALVRRCHRALAQTRGAVLTIASLNALDDTLTWIGVGNVEGRLLRADPAGGEPHASVLLRNGVVGLQLPPLQAAVLPVAPGDLLIFATDGIHADFDGRLDPAEPPQQLAERILQRHFKGTDDALALVVRYVGMTHE